MNLQEKPCNGWQQLTIGRDDDVIEVTKDFELMFCGPWVNMFTGRDEFFGNFEYDRRLGLYFGSGPYKGYIARKSFTGVY